MSALKDEIDANAAAFMVQWQKDINLNIGKLSVNPIFTQSYARLSALQALRTSIIIPSYSKEAAGFFTEAQNDALTSHVLASFGAWRSSLQSLRSCIENVLCALYYGDHPVELKLWSISDFRVGFSELHSYFCKHPDLKDVGLVSSGLAVIKDEYSTLSKAVHGSATSFRMTDSVAGVLLWSDEAPKLGMWATRQKKVMEAVCLLTISLHLEKLSGTKLSGIRSVLGHAISKARRTEMQVFHVHIDDPS